MEFTRMRRKDRELPEQEARQLLGLAKWGTLSLVPDELGYPHAVPINCAYVDGHLLLHCARQGKKLDLLDKDPRACFSAVLAHVPELAKYTAHYESVICYGRVERLPEDEAAEALGRFTAGVFDVPVEQIAGDMQRAARNVLMLRMTIEHITGKRSGPVNSLARE